MFFVFYCPSFQHLLIKWGWWNILDLTHFPKVWSNNQTWECFFCFFFFSAFQHLLTERLSSFCTQDSKLQNDGTSNKFLLISFICFHFGQKQIKSVKHWNFKQNWCLRKIIIFFCTMSKMVISQKCLSCGGVRLKPHPEFVFGLLIRINFTLSWTITNLNQALMKKISSKHC